MLKPITSTFDLDIIDADGIELYTSDGKTYYDLNEISTVLGQKNKHFTDRMSDRLHGVTSMKSGKVLIKKNSIVIYPTPQTTDSNIFI